MAYNHLSQAECDQYDIYISNDELEDNLEENQHSTASSWETTLQSSLDLSTLLYMKSVSALVGLTKLTFDNLPLTLSELETIKVQIKLPEAIVHCNQYYNIESLGRFNDTPLILPMENFCTNNPEEVLMFLNEKLGVPVTEFVIQRFLTIVLDTDIFLEKKSGSFSLKDFRLLTRYVDIALINRHIIHNFLCLQAGINDDSMTNLVSFQSRENITRRNEEAMLNESTTLRQIEDRDQAVHGNSMNLALFYGLSLPDVYTSKDGPKHAVETQTLNWLNILEALERTTPGDPTSALTTDCEFEMKRMIPANKNLILLSLKTRQIINFLKERLDKRNKKKTSSLFHDQFLSLSLDSSNCRCAFHINPKLFLEPQGGTITVFFAKQISYVLGTRDGQELTVGPISYNMPEATSPKLSHEIKSPNQTPPSAIRPLPKLIYVATNLVASLSRDMWLQNTKYSAFHLIYCHVVDESAINNKFICKDTQKPS